MPSILSIGLITYNRAPAIALCLESLTKQTRIPDQVIIVDSSDHDETRMIAERFRQELNILYLKQKERTIMPVGRNICLSNSTSQYITFIDDDAIAKQKWVETIVNAFCDNKNLGGVTGPTINTTPDLKPLEKILTGAKNRNTILPWGEVRSDARRWVPPQPVFCTAMQGGNMSYPVALLRELGGFDEQYFNPSFREESDLQMRILKKGFKFLYHPDVFVWHVPGIAGGIQDIEQDPSRYFCLAGENHRYFCDKYFSKWLTRPAWLLWNGNPPCLWLAFLFTVLRRKNYFAWHRGLWGRPRIVSKIHTFHLVVKHTKNWWTYLLDYTHLMRLKRSSSFTLVFRDGHKARLRPDTTDRGTLTEIFFMRMYSPPDFSIGQNDIVVDIGAHIGMFVLFAAIRAERGKVFAFEPNKENYELLRANVEENSLGNVRIFHAGVADTSGMKKLYISNRAPDCHNFFTDESGEFESISCYNLGQFMHDEKIDAVDYLKMDCEGSEYEILYSLPDVLFPRIKKIALEIHSKNPKQNPDALVKFLQEKGYRVTRQGFMAYAIRCIEPLCLASQ